MGLNTLGWAFLIGAWTFITVLGVWCLRKIMTTEENYDD